MEPREADEDLGYILCDSQRGRARRVIRFVERPSKVIAAELHARGAPWNTLIFAARGTTLLGQFRARMPTMVDAMETALARDRTMAKPTALDKLYEELSPVDFSGEVLATIPAILRTVAVAECGWSDLGTPPRVQPNRSGPIRGEAELQHTGYYMQCTREARFGL